MSFYDLPDNWCDLSLRNPTLAADVVDLVVSERDRRDNTLAFLLCDDLGRLIQPICIGRIEWGCDANQRRRGFDWLGRLPSELSRSLAGVVLALGHRQSRVRQSDLAWARTAEELLAEFGLELFGCFVAHSGGVQCISRPEGQVA
jgi:hypothetical protein